MAKEKNVALKLAAELIRYFIEHQIVHLEVDFELTATASCITVSGQTKKKPGNLDELELALKDGRQPEMDVYYNDLIGTDSKNQGYYLLGAMIDSAEIHYDGTTLTIRIGRTRQRRT